MVFLFFPNEGAMTIRIAFHFDSFDKHLLSTYYKSSTVPGTEDSLETKTVMELTKGMMDRCLKNPPKSIFNHKSKMCCHRKLKIHNGGDHL